MNPFHIRKVTKKDCPIILGFIQALAKYEKLSHEVTATVAELEKTLFGERSFAEVLIAWEDAQPVGFALFFHNYSTFLAKPGIHLEDLYVQPSFRGKGYGKALLKTLAQHAFEKNYGRLEWNVLDWNQPAIDFYRSLNAIPMDGWTTFRLTGNALAELANAGSSPTSKR